MTTQLLKEFYQIRPALIGALMLGIIPIVQALYARALGDTQSLYYDWTTPENWLMYVWIAAAFVGAACWSAEFSGTTFQTTFTIPQTRKGWFLSKTTAHLLAIVALLALLVLCFLVQRYLAFKGPGAEFSSRGLNMALRYNLDGAIRWSVPILFTSFAAPFIAGITRNAQSTFWALLLIPIVAYGGANLVGDGLLTSSSSAIDTMEFTLVVLAFAAFLSAYLLLDQIEDSSIQWRLPALSRPKAACAQPSESLRFNVRPPFVALILKEARAARWFIIATLTFAVASVIFGLLLQFTSSARGSVSPMFPQFFRSIVWLFCLGLPLMVGIQAALIEKRHRLATYNIVNGGSIPIQWVTKLTSACVVSLFLTTSLIVTVVALAIQLPTLGIVHGIEERTISDVLYPLIVSGGRTALFFTALGFLAGLLSRNFAQSVTVALAFFVIGFFTIYFLNRGIGRKMDLPSRMFLFSCVLYLPFLTYRVFRQPDDRQLALRSIGRFLVVTLSAIWLVGSVSASRFWELQDFETDPYLPEYSQGPFKPRNQQLQIIPKKGGLYIAPDNSLWAFPSVPMEIDSHGREDFTYEPTRIDADNEWAELSRSAVTIDARRNRADRSNDTARAVYARTQSGAIWQWDAQGISYEKLVQSGADGFRKSTSNRWADIAVSSQYLIAVSTDSELWIWEDGKADAKPELMDDRPIWASVEYANVSSSEGFLLLDNKNRIWRLPVNNSGELQTDEPREFEMLTNLPPTVAIQHHHRSNSDIVVGKTTMDEYWVAASYPNRRGRIPQLDPWFRRLYHRAGLLINELRAADATPIKIHLFDTTFSPIPSNDQYRDVEAILTQIQSAINTLAWTVQESFWRITQDGSVWAAPLDTATEFLDRDNTMRIARREWTVPRFRNYRIGYLDLENGVHVNAAQHDND